MDAKDITIMKLENKLREFNQLEGGRKAEHSKVLMENRRLKRELEVMQRIAPTFSKGEAAIKAAMAEIIGERQKSDDVLKVFRHIMESYFSNEAIEQVNKLTADSPLTADLPPLKLSGLKPGEKRSAR